MPNIIKAEIIATTTIDEHLAHQWIRDENDNLYRRLDTSFPLGDNNASGIYSTFTEYPDDLELLEIPIPLGIEIIHGVDGPRMILHCTLTNGGR